MPVSQDLIQALAYRGDLSQGNITPLRRSLQARLLSINK
jgi:hypothetical protein